MAKQNKTARMQSAPMKDRRGRTAQTRETTPDHPLIGNKAAVQLEKRTEVSRPTSTGGGKNRGDRRDTSPTYSGTTRHAARGNNPRVDVKTRKR